MTNLQRVFDPTGFPPTVEARKMAPPLPSLEGKSLFLVDVGFENSDNFMLTLQEWIAEHASSIRTEVVHWADHRAPDYELCERIGNEGDAAILGVGS